MLILAGVSISAIVGEDGLLTKAQQASFANKLATYNEEFEMNAVEAISDEGVDSRDKITLMNEYVKQYVPSLEDNDIGQFAIINGQLYYVGDEDLEREVCKSQGYNTLPEGMTAEDFASSVESSAIEEILKNMTGDAFTSTDDKGNTQTLGVQLWDKTFANGNRWKIITEVENNQTVATYGTGWYYVEAGNSVEGIGILKNNYIINYSTNKAVKFNAKKHTMLAYGSNVSVKDNLIFNADPSIMEEYNNLPESDRKNFDVSKLGENIELIGYSNESGSIDITKAFSKTSFLFDGIDDYIKVPYDVENNVKKGFTFEFFGKLTGKNTHYIYKDNNYNKQNNSYYYGIFSLSTQYENKQSSIRFGFENGILEYNYGYNHWKDTEFISDWGWLNDGHSHIQLLKEAKFITNQDIYYTICLDCENLTQKYFINGVKIGEVSITQDYVDNFIKYDEPAIAWYNLGRSSMSTDGYWHYGGMECYSLRLYNKSLRDEECIANYNATVSYHDFLVNNGNASTGGNTGGEDIDTIE